MRKIYLIRHGMPDFSFDNRLCIGTTDIPLGPVGRMQALMLSRDPMLKNITQVFSSPLERAVQTAEFLCEKPAITDGLTEMYAGEWDGLPFYEIKRRWPESFEKKHRSGGIVIPGAEDIEAGFLRFSEALRLCLSESSGDIAIVAHNTVMNAFMSHISSGEAQSGPKLPHCSYSIVVYDGEFHVIEKGRVFHPEPDVSFCEELFKAAGGIGAPHCLKASAKAAKKISRILPSLSPKLINESVSLYALGRDMDSKLFTGTEWINELGYREQAAFTDMLLNSDAGSFSTEQIQGAKELLTGM